MCKQFDAQRSQGAQLQSEVIIEARGDYLGIVLRATKEKGTGNCCPSENAKRPAGFIDSEDGTGGVIQGEWRNECGGLPDGCLLSSNHHSRDASEVRRNFLEYFNTTVAYFLKSWVINVFHKDLKRQVYFRLGLIKIKFCIIS